VPAPEIEAFEQAVDAEIAPPTPPAPVAEHEPEVPLTAPEPAFAARVPPPAPDRPHPDRRRAIFFDVENTSRAEHIARVIEHLAVDREAARTEFVAVGNWRVIGHDTARLLAKHGAQLVHSAPSVGVRDWSDLRIAVGAGVWLAAARAGDVIELVSDDRAFDAVGDVAASLGISFRRLSFRRLAGMRAPEPAAEIAAESPAPRSDGREQGRRRRGRGGRGRGRPHQAHPTAPAPRPPVPSLPNATVATNGEPAIEPHTAPHDEIINVVRDLLARSRDGSVSIDTLANALKSRGFRRPPGSPRLITRIRRIREIAIDRNGRITLVGGASPAPAPAPQAAAASEPPPAPVESIEPEEAEEPEESHGNRAMPPPPVEADVEDEGPMPGNERYPSAASQPEPAHRRRRSRRGGRGRRRGRSGATAAP
jgi:hypothetical protein